MDPSTFYEDKTYFEVPEKETSFEISHLHFNTTAKN
jgi:hypothetical protein